MKEQLDTDNEWTGDAADRYGEAVTAQNKALAQIKTITENLQTTLNEIAQQTSEALRGGAGGEAGDRSQLEPAGEDDEVRMARLLGQRRGDRVAIGAVGEGDRIGVRARGLDRHHSREKVGLPSCGVK